MQFLKKLTREELGWRRSFEVYCGIKSNLVAKASHESNKTISWVPTSNEPTITKKVKYKSERVKEV